MHTKHLKNLESLKSGNENKAHIFKIGRCLHVNDDRAPFFVKNEKDKFLDSFEYE